MSDNLQIIKPTTKRDIFRFDGDRPTAINLEHVTVMQIEKNRITFTFHSNSLSLDLSDEAMAKEIFEKLLNLWASD